MSYSLKLDWSGEPEKTQVPVRGDCGHIFTVPLLRLQDGAEFKCPVCGQADSIDAEALRAAEEELASLSEKGTMTDYTRGIGAFLERARTNKGSDKD